MSTMRESVTSQFPLQLAGGADLAAIRAEPGAWNRMEKDNPDQGIALIVEDDEDYAALYQRMMDRYGLQSLIVDTAAKARQLLDGQAAVKIALIDLILPDGDGLNLLEYLDGSPLQSRTIAITSSPTIGKAVASHVPVVDKATMLRLREELDRILGPVPAHSIRKE